VALLHVLVKKLNLSVHIVEVGALTKQGQ